MCFCCESRESKWDSEKAQLELQQLQTSVTAIVDRSLRDILSHVKSEVKENICRDVDQTSNEYLQYAAKVFATGLPHLQPCAFGAGFDQAEPYG